MGLLCFIVNAMGRRMSDQYIQRPAIAHAVQEQARQKQKGPQGRFSLRILIDAVRPIAITAAEASQQKSSGTSPPEVKVRTAFGAGGREAGIIDRIVVPGNVEQGHIQDRNDIFQIIVG